MAPPSTPGSPSPADGADGVSASVPPAFTWTADGATSCRVFFGVQPPGDKAGSVSGLVNFPTQGLGSPWPGGLWTRNGEAILSGGTFTFDVEPSLAGVQSMRPLKNETTFYWQVFAYNADGMTAGPLWRFTTGDPPGVPVIVSPDNGGTADLNPSLAWTASSATSYDVYFGTSNPPPLVSSGQAVSVYTPAGPLVDQTQYFWKIVAINSHGSTAGSVWSFTADANAEENMTLDHDVTSTDVVNTTSETTVYSFLVPGGTLSTNRALRLTLIGDYLNNTGSNPQFLPRVKFGGTTLGGHGPNTTSSVNRSPLAIEVVLSAANATNAQVGNVRMRLGNTFGSGLQYDNDAVTTTLAVDSTVDQTLVVTFQHGTANANLSARCFVVHLEKI